MSKKKHRKYDEYALLNYGSDYDDCFEEDTYLQSDGRARDNP